MRLSPEKIAEITGYRRASSQVKWFHNYLGADVPADRFGPIMTDAAYEKLLEKRLGILPSSQQADRPKPRLRLVKDGEQP